MFNTIVVPLDGSAESNAALAPARAIAQATGGVIWLLRVADHSHVHAAGAELDRVAEELTNAGFTVHPVVREGVPAEEILHMSRDIGADLVVMRTHGRLGLDRAIFGSVTEAVLHKTQLPLVLVGPGGRRLSHIRTLLVPVDGSPGGLLALESANALAASSGASITVFEAVVPIPMLAYAAPIDAGGVGYYDSAWDDDALVAARTYVAAVGERLRERGRSVEAEAVMVPSVPEAIVAMADRSGADLIVMSTHALRGPARTILGSVADGVVRTANTPVLLVKRAV